MTTKIAISQKTPGAYQQNRLQEIFRQIETQWNGGSANLEFLQSGTGPIATTLQAKVRSSVPVDVIVDFGAKGDGVTDDSAAIQAAINYCITNHRKLYFPAAVYSIASPLFIYKWSGTAFSQCSLTIEGEKKPWDAEVSGSVNSVRIVPTFINTFAIGIQNGRAVRIKDVALVGQNDFSGNLSADFHQLMTNSTYVINSCRDSQFSPYAGICIDPFGTSTPSDGGYPGLSSYYVASAAGSASLAFDSVVVRGFVAGFMLSPNGTTTNCSEIEFNNCIAEYNKVGLSIGQSQSRNVHWRGGSNTFALYGFDGNTYGSQAGCPPRITGCNMNGKYLFNIYNRTGSPLFAQGVHAETFASIGFLGGVAATASETHKFVGCEFNFTDFGTGTFPDHHLVAQGSVEFDTCDFNQGSQTYFQPCRMYHRSGTNIVFKNCSYAAVLTDFWLAPTEGVDGTEFEALIAENSVFNEGGSRGPSSGQTMFSHRQNWFSASNYAKNIAPFGAIYRFFNDTAALLHFVGGDQSSVSLGSVTVTTGANGTATFTVADGTIVRTGDLIYTTTSSSYESYSGGTFSSASECIGIVTNVNVNAITISGWPQSLSTGTYALKTMWWTRFHPASTGDIATNTTISNVTPTAAWANGQHIKGAGIPSGAYIVSGGGTATLTISKAATATTVGIRLYDADVYSLTGTAV